MTLDDIFGKEIALAEHDRAQCRVIGVICNAAHVGRFEQRTILIVQSLMVSNMVRKDFEVVSDVAETLGAGNRPHGSAVDSDCNRVFLCKNVCNGLKNRILSIKGNACGLCKVVHTNIMNLEGRLTFGVNNREMRGNCML